MQRSARSAVSLDVSAACGVSVTTIVLNGPDTLLVQDRDGVWHQVVWIVDANVYWPLFKSYVLAHSLQRLAEYDVVASVRLPKSRVNDFLPQQRKKTSDVVR